MSVDDASTKGDLATEPKPGEGNSIAVPTRRRLGVAARAEPASVPAEEKKKVVHIVRRLEEESSRNRKLSRSSWLIGSVVAVILLPTLIVALFYIFIASDRYVSEARFAVRSNETQAVDALGMITGLSSTQTTSDSYIVTDYVTSRDMVKELERRLPFRAIYEKGDLISRLSRTATLEDLVAYWQQRVDVYYDSTKNTVDVEVQAFDAEDANRIAHEIVDVVHNLVNDLSAQARRDAMQFAASEVARAELRVRGARQDVLNFRLAHNDLDPSQTATATLGIAAQLEGERSKLLSDLASVSGYLTDDAPSVQMLKSRIAALAGEITRIQGQVSTGLGSNSPTTTITSDAVGSLNTTDTSGARATSLADPAGDIVRDARAIGGKDVKPDALANMVGTYEELVLNQEFAEKAYAAAAASFEHARAEATHTDSYLAIYGTPTAADEATYPNRVLNVVIVFILACVLWWIGMLGTLTIRDHIR